METQLQEQEYKMNSLERDEEENVVGYIDYLVSNMNTYFSGMENILNQITIALQENDTN